MLDQQTAKAIFKAGQSKSVSAQEIYYQSAKNISISVFNGEIEKYALSEEGGLSYRAIFDGKMGYTYSERIDDIDPISLVEEAIGNAKVIEAEDEVFIYGGKDQYAEVETYNPDSEKRQMKDKIEFMLKLEKALLNSDTRVKRMAGNNLSETVAVRQIINSKGLELSETSNYCFAYATVVVEADGDTRTGMGYDVSDDFAKLSVDKIVDMAVEEALKMLGAKPIDSVKCPVVVKNEVFGQFLSAFNSLYSAERVQKNLSKLKGKLETQIASDLVTIYDDPHLEKGLSTTAFDAEGVATKKKALVEKGVLKTYLHNLKTAKVDGTVTTGNASKGSFKGTVGIAPFNVYLDKGTKTFDQMISEVDYGVYIVSLQGLHSGINGISGDFSLQCYGYVIENGKITIPTSQITVSGNFFDLLMDISDLSDDLTFSLLGSGYTGAPSVRIKALDISGN